MNNRELLLAIGARIKKIRLDKKFTQNELALSCEFEKATMSRIESGQTNITMLTLHKICQSLQVNMSFILQDVDCIEA